MGSLFTNTCLVGTSTHHIGVFGCTLSKPSDPAILLDATQNITANRHLTFQIVNSACVVSEQHLLFAAIHALRAFFRGTQRASTLALEILRFAAAQRQISEALTQLGITKATQQLAGVLVSPNEDTLHQSYSAFQEKVNAIDTPDVLTIANETKLQTICEAFQIKTQELEAIVGSSSFDQRCDAVQKLVYERCALLAVSH
ncbi:MAG: KEOPS complex subunit Cgi121 [Candidatus Thorarchaeota archaeon]